MARGVFADGLTNDPHCAPLYHSAALLEARLGNLEGLYDMHSKAQGNLRVFPDASISSELEGDNNIIEKISMLVQEAEAGTYDQKEVPDFDEDDVYDDEM